MHNTCQFDVNMEVVNKIDSNITSSMKRGEYCAMQAALQPALVIVLIFINCIVRTIKYIASLNNN